MSCGLESQRCLTPPKFTEVASSSFPNLFQIVTRGTTYQKNCLKKKQYLKKVFFGIHPKVRHHPRRRLGISSALLSDGLCFFLIFNVFVIIFLGCVGSSLLCVDFSLVMVSRGYSSAAMHRLLTVVASLVEHRL